MNRMGAVNNYDREVIVCAVDITDIKYLFVFYECS